jgi:fumarate reductase subunit D
MIKRHPEPLLWMLFSAGGVLSALLLPILFFLFGIAFPLGWLTAPTRDQLLAVLGNPLTRLVVFVLCALSLFHWAHRFRQVIALASYGGAIVGSVVAAYLLWQVP